MLCDIHIERNYNVNYRNPPWLRDRVFVIFAASSAFRLQKVIKQRLDTLWGYYLRVHSSSLQPAAYIVLSAVGLGYLYLVVLVVQVYDLDSMGLYWKGLIGFLLPQSHRPHRLRAQLRHMPNYRANNSDHHGLLYSTPL